MPAATAAAADLYGIPLGAGGHSVRHKRQIFSAVAAARRRTSQVSTEPRR